MVGYDGKDTSSLVVSLREPQICEPQKQHKRIKNVKKKKKKKREGKPIFRTHQ